jgi:hypothetical protein
MYNLLKVGEEVTFPGLLDIRLIVEEVHENRGNVRCKYYDDHLKRYIKLTLPTEALVPFQKVKPKLKTPDCKTRKTSFLGQEPAGSFRQGPADDIY